MSIPLPPPNPVASFLECHNRIDRFLTGMGRLAALDDLADPRAPEAARQCARYFREGLPLHGQDEDLSLAPRLRAVNPGPAALDALDQMALDHAQMDEGLPALLAQLDAIAAGTPGTPEALRSGHAWLDQLLRTHVALEEAVVFPACAALDADTLAIIAAEMRARRS